MTRPPKDIEQREPAGERPAQRSPMTVPRVAEMKRSGEPIVMVTAYDFPSAQVAEEAGVDIVLVGDTAAMVVLGYDSTPPVGMDEMVMLAAAVRRGLKTPLLVGDLPFGSYERSNEQAIESAQRFVKEAGCDAVKLERGGVSVERARAIIRSGIPVMGHVGLTPQTAVGAGRVQGPGPHGRGRGQARRGDPRAAVDRLLRGRLRGDPRRGHRGPDVPPGGAGDRHRRGARDGRPGAGLPRPARHLRRPHPALRAPLRGGPRGDGRAASASTRPTCAPGASPTEEHTYSISPEELEEFKRYLSDESLAGTNTPWDW